MTTNPSDWWGQLESGLVDLLPDLASGDVLLLAVGEDGPFANFLQQPTWLTAEVSKGAEPALRALGWEEPQPAADRPNWWLEVAWPLRTADYRRLAEMTVATLRDVHRVEAAALHYRSWSLARGKFLRWGPLDRLQISTPD